MKARTYAEDEVLGVGARTVPFVPEARATHRRVRATLLGFGVLALLGAGWRVARRLDRH